MTMSRQSWWRAAAALAGGALLVAALVLSLQQHRPVAPAGPPGSVVASSSAAPPSGRAGGLMVAAAGDITCQAAVQARAARRSPASCQAKATSGLLIGRRLAGVLVLGDAVNSFGADREYRRAYGPTWGRVKAITHPGPGNHDYRGVGGAAAYFRYFGATAGPRSRGYYSFDLGAWHLIALNSNCGRVGGCQAGSRQERWLRADLARHPSRCTLAYWHRPRFSSRRRGTDGWSAAFWRDLYRAGAELVLNGHDHDFERFAPLDPAGTPDPARGVREFVVGTGGKSHLPLTTVQVGSQVRNADTFGVLELTLRPGGYGWRFRPVAGGSFTDAGAAACH
jgi:acid phosphatase type 7